MPQDPIKFTPDVYRNFVGNAIDTAPPPPLSPAQDGLGKDGLSQDDHRPIMVTDQQVQQNINKSPRKPYSYNISDPYEQTIRYMTGLFHYGYVGPNSEQYNAERQSTAGKWINGVAKFAGNAFTTFVSGTVGLANGLNDMLASPITEGHFDFSKFYDNYTDQKMSELSGYMEKMFPHYYTEASLKGGPFSSDNWATANFWADGLLKNAGFAVGALATGRLGAGLLTKFPQIADWALAIRKSLAAGEFGRDFRLMEQGISRLGDLADVEARANVIQEVLFNPKKLEELGISAERVAKVGAFDTKFKTAFSNGFVNTLGAIGESNMEAMQGIETIRRQLTDSWSKEHNGDQPDAQTMEVINERAQEGANWRWWFNAVTLSITNSIQFPRLFNNGVKNQFNAFNHEIREIVAVDTEGKVVGDIARPHLKDQYVDMAAKAASKRSKMMNIVNAVYQFAKGPVLLSEAAEEGLQYTYEKGTESYEQMKFDSKATNLLRELIFTGIPATFHDKEGIESMIFGGLTGKLMDLSLGRAERARLRTNTEEARSKFNDPKHNLADYIGRDAAFESAVRNGASPYIDEVNISNIRGQAINEENNKAVVKGDINRMRNLDSDWMHNITMPRLNYGRKEVFKEELRQYHSSNMPIAEARQALGLGEDIASEDLDRSIDKRIKQVDQLDNFRTFILGTFGVTDPKTGKPKYAKEVMDQMIYSLFKIDMHDERHDKLIQQIQAATGVDMSALDSYYKRKRAGVQEDGIEGHKDLDTVRNEITKEVTRKVKEAVKSNPKIEKDDNGISIFDKLKDIETIQNDREQFVRSYYQLREQTADKPLQLIAEVKTREDLEKLEETEQYVKLATRLNRATTARRLAVKMSMALSAMNENNLEEVQKQINEIHGLVGTEGNFLFESERKYLREFADRLRQKLFDQALNSVPQPATPIPGTEGMDWRKMVDMFKTEIQDHKEGLNLADDSTYGLSPEQVSYAANVLEAFDKLQGPLVQIDEILNQLETEPVTPPISELKREIADGFMNKYEEIKTVINNDDYADVAEVARLLHRLKEMKELYKDRKELLATKAFKGFMDLLDSRIKEVESWMPGITKRADNLLKNDEIYYINRVFTQWSILGFTPGQDFEAPEAGKKPDHISDEELYKLITAMLGEETVLNAFKAFRADYKAGKPDAEKHALGLLEMIRKAPPSDNRTKYSRALHARAVSPALYMLTNSFEHILPESNKRYFDYPNTIADFANTEEFIFKSLFDPQGAAYQDYLQHGDIIRFSVDVRKDIDEGKFNYGAMPAEWTTNLLNYMVASAIARRTQSLLNSRQSLTNIYDALKYTVGEQQTKGAPTPSDKQLMSMMDMILHAYDKRVSPTTEMDPIIYLDGRIGAGKTVMTSILLKTLARIENMDITKMALLTGDTAIVGTNLEEATGVDQTQGKGYSLENVMDFLHGKTTIADPAMLKFIVVDEAARVLKDIPALATALQSYNNKHGQNLRIFLLGDSKQVTGTLAVKNRVSHLTGIHTATSLTTSFRGKVPSINIMHSVFLNGADKDYRGTPLTFTANTDTPWDANIVGNMVDNLLLGVSGSPIGTSRSQQINLALQTMKNRSGVTVDGKALTKAVIVNRTFITADGKKVDSGDKVKEWIARLEQIQPGLSKEFTVLSYYDAQGKSFDEVYLDLDVDAQDSTISNNQFLNTAVYTSARARNFVYLINNSIKTETDPGLLGQFYQTTQTLGENAQVQAKKIESIYQHLNTISSTTVQAPPKQAPPPAPPAPPPAPPVPPVLPTGKPAGTSTKPPTEEEIRNKMADIARRRKERLDGIFQNAVDSASGKINTWTSLTPAGEAEDSILKGIASREELIKLIHYKYNVEEAALGQPPSVTTGSLPPPLPPSAPPPVPPAPPGTPLNGPRKELQAELVDKAKQEALKEHLPEIEGFYWDLPQGLSKEEEKKIQAAFTNEDVTPTNEGNYDEYEEKYEKPINTLSDLDKAREVEKNYPWAIGSHAEEAHSTEDILKEVERHATKLEIEQGTKSIPGAGFDALIGHVENDRIPADFQAEAERILRKYGLFELVGYNPGGALPITPQPVTTTPEGQTRIDQMEQERSDKLDELTAKKQTITDKKLAKKPKRMSKAQLNKLEAKLRKKYETEIAWLEEHAKDKTIRNEWNDRFEALSNKARPFLDIDIDDETKKITFDDYQDYRGENFGGNDEIIVSASTLHSFTEAFQAGDKLRVDTGTTDKNGARVHIKATVTKVNNNGRILEAAERTTDGTGELIIRNGQILSPAKMTKARKINEQYDQLITAVNKQVAEETPNPKPVTRYDQGYLNSEEYKELNDLQDKIAELGTTDETFSAYMRGELQYDDLDPDQQNILERYNELLNKRITPPPPAVIADTGAPVGPNINTRLSEQMEYWEGEDGEESFDDGDYSYDGFSELPTAEEDVEKEEPLEESRESRQPTRIGKSIISTSEGRIGIDLTYPTGAALHSYNNITVKTAEGIVLSRPQVGDEIRILSMPVDPAKGPYKYGVFRHTGHSNIYQLLGVLSKEETEGTGDIPGIIDYVPGFRDYHARVLKENQKSAKNAQGGMYGIRKMTREKFSDLVPMGAYNSFYQFSTVPPPGDGINGSVLTLTELKYQYSPEIESSLVNLNSEGDGIDWIGAPRLGKGTDHSILRIWYNGMFLDKDGNKKVPDAPSYEKLLRDAHIQIITIDPADYREITKGNRLDSNYSPETAPVQIGRTYLEIKNIPGLKKPQYIALQGAILNNTGEFDLHAKLYLDPIMQFVEAAEEMSQKLNHFIFNVMGEDPEKFRQLWRGNTYTSSIKTDRGTTDMTFRRDNPTDFDISSYVFNLMVKKLVNMKWVNPDSLPDVKRRQARLDLGDNLTLSNPYTNDLIGFMNRFFERVVKEGKDEELSMAARKLRLSQKDQVNAKEGPEPQEGQADKRPVKMMQYSNKRKVPVVDMRAIKKRSSALGSRKAQSVLISLAQANGFITSPITGKKINILSYLQEKQPPGSPVLTRTVRSAYDLLSEHWKVAKLKSQKPGNIKGFERDIYYIITGHQVQKELRSTEIPMHLNLPQLKKQLDFIVNSFYFKQLIGQKKEYAPFAKMTSINPIYEAVINEYSTNSNITTARDLFHEIMTQALSAYSLDRLSIADLRAVFGEDGFNEKGQSKQELRVNVPIWLSKPKEGNLRWEDAARPDSALPIARATPQQRIGQMLSTHFTGVEGSQIAVELNAEAPPVENSLPNMEEAMPGEGEPFTQQGTPPSKTDSLIITPETEDKGSQPAKEEKGDSRITILTNNPPSEEDWLNSLGDGAFHGDPGTEKMSKEVASAALREMVPGISESDIYFLNALQMMKQFNVSDYGVVKNGAVAFLTGEDGTVYQRVVKHEALHLIFRYFTNSQQRDRIINAAIQHYGLTDTRPDSVEEHLATEFGKRQESWLPSILRSFFNWLSRIFRLITRHEYEINQYFNKIENGELATPADRIMNGTALYSNFRKYYNRDQQLYEKTWSTFARDYQKYSLNGEEVVIDEENMLIPLADNEILNKVYNEYQTASQTLNKMGSWDEVSPINQIKLARKGIVDDASMQQMKEVYGKLANREIFTDLVQTKYRNKFKIPEGEEPNPEGAEYIAKESTGGTDDEDLITTEAEDSTEDAEVPFTSEGNNANLEAEIKQENDLNPRSTLTEQVHMNLQTITDINNKPVSKENSIYFLYHSINNLPLDVYDSNDLSRSKKIALKKLGDGFRKFMSTSTLAHPDHIQEALTSLDSAAYSYSGIKKGAGEVAIRSQARDTLSTLINYFQEIVATQMSPNIKYSMLRAVEDMKTIRATLEDAAFDEVPERLKAKTFSENLRYVVEIAEDMRPVEFSGNVQTMAVYDSMRRLMLDTYANRYIKKGHPPTMFRGDRGFTNDDQFVYGIYTLNRRHLGKDQMSEPNLVFMQRIAEFIRLANRNVPVSDKNTDAVYTLKDVLAIWRQRKAYNVLTDIMNVVNNCYTTRPYRIISEQRDNSSVFSLQNVALDDIRENVAQHMMTAIDTKMRFTNPDGIAQFDESAFSRSIVAMNGSDAELLKTFYDESGTTKPDLYLIPGSELVKRAAEGVRQILGRVREVLTNPYINVELFNVEKNIFQDASGYLRRDIVQPLLNTQNDRNLNTYQNGRGEYVSGIRQMSYADSVMNNILNFQNGDQKEHSDDWETASTLAPFLIRTVKHMKNGKGEDVQSVFTKLNPINPAGFSPLKLEIGEARLFDSHKDYDFQRREWITVYEGEGRKDILGRYLVGNYMAAITHPHLFPRGKMFTIQPFYVMADRGRSQGVEMELIPTRQEADHITNLLFQIMHRPDPDYRRPIMTKNKKTGKMEQTGEVRPYNNKGYNPNFSPFKQETLSESEIAELRKEYEPKIQKELAGTNKGPMDTYYAFKNDSRIKAVIAKIQAEFRADRDFVTNFIVDSVNRNSTYKIDNRTGSIQQQVASDTAFKLPDINLLEDVYVRLLKNKQITQTELTELSQGKVIVKYGEDGESIRGVEIKGYSNNKFDTSVQKEHLLPLIHHFIMNDFIRGYFVGQMIMDDNSVFNSHEKMVKRMAMITSSGNAYHNIGNVLRGEGGERPADAMKFLVIEDVIRYRNLKMDIKEGGYDPRQYNDPIAKRDMPVKMAREIMDTLSKRAQLSRPQYDNLVKAFQILRDTGQDTANLVDEFQKLNLSMSKAEVNNAAAWLTQRAHLRLMLAGGATRNSQDIMKPAVMGRDKYNIVRNAKFATETLTDDLVAKFPALFELRFQADFGSLNKPATKRLYDTAYRLESERIQMIRDNPEKPGQLEPEDSNALQKIYERPENDPAHVITPDSAIKFNAPATQGKYNYVTEGWDTIDHHASSFTLSMKDFRIQQNPVNDPHTTTVAIFTQLMYMSNTNGNNAEEMSQLFNTYAEIKRISFEDVLEKYPTTIPDSGKPATAEMMNENRNSAVNMILDEYGDNPIRAREQEYMQTTLAAADDPSIADTMISQMMSIYKRVLAGHRLPGMKLVQVTPAGRSEAFTKSGLKEPQYDRATMTAEVYLPARALKQMRKQNPEYRDNIPELIKRIPVSFAFRVPSTGLNSAVRIKVLGFYPGDVNAIIGPADVALIMGSDFDVDALFNVQPDYGRIENVPSIKKAYGIAIKEMYGDTYNHTPIGFNTVKKAAGYEIEPIPGFLTKLKGLYDTSSGAMKRAYRHMYISASNNNLLYNYNQILAKRENRDDVTHAITFDVANSMFDEKSLFNQRAFVLSKAYEDRWKEYKANGLLYDEDKRDKLSDTRNSILNGGYNVNTVRGKMNIQVDTMGSNRLIGVEASAAKGIAYDIYAVNPGERMRVYMSRDKNYSFIYNGHSKSFIGDYNKKTGQYEIKLETSKSIFQALEWIINGTIDAVKEGIPAVMNLTRATAQAWTGGLVMGLSELSVQNFMNSTAIREIADTYPKGEAQKDRILANMQRELMAQYIMVERKIRKIPASIQRVYADLDSMKPEALLAEINKLKAGQYIGDDNCRRYGVHPTLSQALETLDGNPNELKNFLRYNMAVLDTYKKMLAIGDAFYTLQRISSIIKGPRKVTYKWYQSYMKDVYSMYRTRRVFVEVPSALDPKKLVPVETYYRDFADSKGNRLPDGEMPVVRDDFPIQGINLFRLPHFKVDFDKYRYTNAVEQATHLKNHPMVENVSVAIVKQFNIKVGTGKSAEFDAVDAVKNHMMTYLHGLTVFTNSDGTETPLRIDPRHKYQTRGRTFYGAAAFMQQFADEIVNNIKFNSRYSSNPFFDRMKVDTGVHGVRSISTRKLTGLNAYDLAALEKHFDDIDNEDRAEHPEAGWRSPLQIDLLRNAQLEYNMMPGSTKYTAILSPEMRGQLMKNLFRQLTPFLNMQRSEEREGRDDDKKREMQVFISTVFSKNVFQHAALAVQLNNPALIKELSAKDNMLYEGGKDKAQSVIDRNQEEQHEAHEPPSNTVKYNSGTRTYYHLQLPRNVSKDKTIDDIYPLLIKNRRFSYGRISNDFEVFVRVHYTVTDQGDNNLMVAQYIKLGNLDSARGIMLTKEVLQYGYNLRDMFNPYMPQFSKKSLVGSGDILRVNADLTYTPRQRVLLYEEGDYTREEAEVYEVAEVVSKGDARRVKDITKEINKAATEKNYMKRTKEIDRLVALRESFYSVYRLRNISEGEVGVRAIKKINGQLTDTLEGNALKIEQLLGDPRQVINMDLKRSDTDSSIYSFDEQLIIDQALKNGDIEQCK